MFNSGYITPFTGSKLGYWDSSFRHRLSPPPHIPPPIHRGPAQIYPFSEKEIFIRLDPPSTRIPKRAIEMLIRTRFSKRCPKGRFLKTKLHRLRENANNGKKEKKKQALITFYSLHSH